MRAITIAGAGLVLAATAAAPAPGAAARLSRFTTLEKCRVIDRSKEAEYLKTRCPGLGGYVVDLTTSDGRDGLTLIAGKRKVELDLAPVTAGRFTTMGKQLEWRGTAAGTFKPDAIIFRLGVQETDNGGMRSYLIVASLKSGCVIGKIAPGAKQNANAQALADKGGRCL